MARIENHYNIAMLVLEGNEKTANNLTILSGDVYDEYINLLNDAKHLIIPVMVYESMQTPTDSTVYFFNSLSTESEQMPSTEYSSLLQFTNISGVDVFIVRPKDTEVPK